MTSHTSGTHKYKYFTNTRTLGEIILISGESGQVLIASFFLMKPSETKKFYKISVLQAKEIIKLERNDYESVLCTCL